MNRSIDVVWFSAYEFHNVNFAGCRPAILIKVISEHPERGPDSLTIRELDSRLDPPILPGMETLRLEPCRGIGAPAAEFLAGFDHQHSIFHAYIFGAIRIVLPLLVTPAMTSEIERPVFKIYFRSLEFILPYKIPPGTFPLWCR